MIRIRRTKMANLNAGHFRKRKHFIITKSDREAMIQTGIMWANGDEH